MKPGAAPAAVGLASLLLAGLVLRQGVLIVLATVLLLAIALAEVWRRRCLERIEYRRRFSSLRASFGAEVELTVEVTNRKALPLAWLEVTDELPAALAPTRGIVTRSWRAGRSVLTNLMMLLPYEQVRRHYALSCDVRGEHAFGPATLRSGDPFGFAVDTRASPSVEKLVVYPRVVPVRLQPRASQRVLGGERVRRSLFADPSRIAGSRELLPGDSLRHIDWPASARAQRLQVRRYDPAAGRHHLLCLDVDASEDGRWWSGIEPDAQEMAIVAAASLAAWLADRGVATAFCANGKPYGAASDARLPASSRPEQRARILEMLGRLMLYPTGPVELPLLREGGRLPDGAAITLVTHALLAPKHRALRRLASAGYATTAVVMGDRPLPSSSPGVVIRRPAMTGLSWRDVGALVLV